jgi:hypothetical protein
MKISKKYVKIICILVMMLCVMILVYPAKAAATSGGSLLKNMEDQTKQFINTGSGQVSKNIDYNNVVKDFVGLGQILTFLGGGMVVAVVIYMGIKYLTAGPEAQAKLKTQLIGVVVSAMVIFGAYFIWSTVVNVASTF